MRVSDGRGKGEKGGDDASLQLAGTTDTGWPGDPTDASVDDIWPSAPENSILSVQRPIDVMSVYVVASGTQPRTRLGT
jgi:hypothetical protein